MIYRVIYTLVTGFALLTGSACLGQADSLPAGSLPVNGAVVEQSNSQAPAGAATKSPNPSDSTATASWWQRLATPAGANKQPAKGNTAAVAPAAQPATSAAGSTSYFGKLFKVSDKKREQKDPFAVKAVAYEEPTPKPTVVAAALADPTKCDLTPPPAAPNPWAAPAGEPLAASPAGNCPYPDTGIQTLYQPVQGASGTVVSDNPKSPAEPPMVGKVHGAFDGLLGHDDVRTQKEAASAPLLSPYKDLPVDHPLNSSAAQSVKRGPSVSGDSKKAVAETAKSASAPANAQSDVYTDKPKTDTNESVVNAAFTLPPTDAPSKGATAQATASASGAVNAATQAATPQPLQLNGVEAHQLTGNPLNRPKFIYRPATSVVDTAGHKLIKPEVHVAADSVASDLPTSVKLANFAAETEENLPPQNMAPENAYPIDEQQWMPQMSGCEGGECDNCQDCNGHGWLHGHNDCNCCRSGGIGVEHVAQAPFFIQTTEPFNNCRVRLDLARDLEFPDRSEFFWAKTLGGKGPGNTLAGEPAVNYQDLNFYIEKGTKRLSIGTDLTIRAVDPLDIRDDSVGFGDMVVRTKAVLMDGKNWQLTNLFNTYIPTGTASHGIGDGHVSLEPGVAYRWKWSDWTYFHGDLKYLFPIGADPNFAGQIFNYGFGWSHVAVETDTWALIPTFEVECWTFVDGQQTLPFPVNPPIAENINNIGIMNICPGLRWVCDKGCDCGTKEFGISAGVAVTNEHLYEEILRLELRWSR